MKRTLIIVDMILALAFVGCGASSEYIYMSDSKFPYEIKDNCVSVSEFELSQDYYK